MSKKSGAARRKRKEEYVRNVDVALVHGIGLSEPGSSFRSQGIAILQALQDDALDRGFSVSCLIAGNKRSEQVLSIVDPLRKSTTRVCVREVSWAEHRKSGIRHAAWTLAMLPALLLLLLGDPRDVREVSPEGFIGGNRMWRRHLRAAARIWLMIFGATLALAAVLAVIMALLDKGAPLATFLFILLTISLLLLLSSRLNIAGQVALAVRSGLERDALIQDVHAGISVSLSAADECFVVAHSQGGYLAYMATLDLTADEASKVNLWTLGSGLRPISLLAGVQKFFPLFLAWMTLLVSALFSVLLAGALPLVMGVVPAFLDSFRGAFDVGLFTMRWPNVERVAAFAATRADVSLSQLDGLWPQGVLLLFAYGLLVQLISRAMLVDVDLPTRDTPLRSWVDVTTVHDLVGRICSPPVAGAERHIVSLGGSAYHDHVDYARPWSIVPRFIAKAIGVDSWGRPNSPVWDCRLAEVNRSFLFAARARRRLAWMLGIWVASLLAALGAAFSLPVSRSTFAGIFWGGCAVLLGVFVGVLRERRFQEQHLKAGQDVYFIPLTKLGLAAGWSSLGTAIGLTSLAVTNEALVMAGDLYGTLDIRNGVVPPGQTLGLAIATPCLAFLAARILILRRTAHPWVAVAALSYPFCWLLDHFVFGVPLVWGVSWAFLTSVSSLLLVFHSSRA